MSCDSFVPENLQVDGTPQGIDLLYEEKIDGKRIQVKAATGSLVDPRVKFSGVVDHPIPQMKVDEWKEFRDRVDNIVSQMERLEEVVEEGDYSDIVSYNGYEERAEELIDKELS